MDHRGGGSERAVDAVLETSGEEAADLAGDNGERFERWLADHPAGAGIVD